MRTNTVNDEEWERSASYYFTVSPDYLAESEVEISEREFAGDLGHEALFPGGIDYKIRLRNSAPPATQAAIPPT